MPDDTFQLARSIPADDVRLWRPPDDPLTYLDVVVTHPEGDAWRRGAAAADGCAAEGAARRTEASASCMRVTIAPIARARSGAGAR